jgi:hypothetical protein
MSTISLSSRIAIASLFLGATASICQPEVDSEFNELLLRSDASTQEEIKRIGELPIPPFQLIPDNVRTARATAKQYKEVENRSVPSVDLESFQRDIHDAAEKLISASASCRTEDVIDAVADLRSAVERTGPVAFRANQDYLTQESPGERNARQEVFAITGSDSVNPPSICSRLRDQARKEKFRAAIESFLVSIKKRIDFLRSSYSAAVPRAQSLEKAWMQRESRLTDELRAKGEGSDLLLRQLPWYIGIFCLFGLAIIAIVRLFQGEVQMEWVASGQVIQFATVMVLLIVIAALGIAHTLSENTLGTLLGGVAGYVLSQGVGRAVARATERAVDFRGARQRTREEVCNWLYPIISRHTNIVGIHGNHSLESDLRISPEDLSKLIDDINSFLRALGGRELSRETFGKATTVESLVNTITDSLARG